MISYAVAMLFYAILCCGSARVRVMVNEQLCCGYASVVRVMQIDKLCCGYAIKLGLLGLCKSISYAVAMLLS